jgi:hypothetical protein
MADYEKTHMISTRRWKRTAILAALGIGVIVLASIGVWMSPGGGKGQDIGTGQRRFETGTLNEKGTTGRADIEGAENSGPAATPITDPVDAATGPSKVRHLIGRRVEIEVPLGAHVNDVAFWARYEEHPLLVVLSRDARDGAARQRGEPTPAAIGDADASGNATVTGRIEQIPHAEAMHSWGLTNSDREQLLKRPVYLRVTGIEPNSRR